MDNNTIVIKTDGIIRTFKPSLEEGWVHYSSSHKGKHLMSTLLTSERAVSEIAYYTKLAFRSQESKSTIIVID